MQKIFLLSVNLDFNVYIKLLNTRVIIYNIYVWWFLVLKSEVALLEIF